MSEGELERFEAELGRLAPAKPPAELVARLAGAAREPRGALASARVSVGNGKIAGEGAGGPGWGWWLRWLAPAAAAAVVVLTLVRWPSSGPRSESPRTPDAAEGVPVVKADDIEFDQRLIASFDEVAELPGGEPVRFRCREWEDAVVLRDSARGIVIERRVPRVEAVPVRFEIY